jgi:beta-glucanase (GH16 family)
VIAIARCVVDPWTVYTLGGVEKVLRGDEIYNDSTRRILFTTYSGDRLTNTATMKLPFDATAAYHNYAFRYGPGIVRPYVDGKLMKTFREGVPNSSMYLYTNTWFPRWLGGTRPKSDRYLMVDWTRYSL